MAQVIPLKPRIDRKERERLAPYAMEVDGEEEIDPLEYLRLCRVLEKRKELEARQ